jgi:hypothetical protein
MARGGGGSAGPTGVAWVDSNGWLARLTAARNPGKSVWVEAAPANTRFLRPSSYMTVVADAAACGARWIVTLDDTTAAGILKHDSAPFAAWQAITAATRFFAAHQEWSTWNQQALIGVVGTFQGDNEFLGQELLNLLDRAGMHNRVLLKDRLPADPFRGLRAVLYADKEPLSEALRKQIGSLLIPNRTGTEDPYEFVQDAVIQVSHRYDLVRCWNTGAMSSNYLVSPDRSKAVVHLIFYADRGPDSASVRVVGKWRTAGISTIDQPAPQPVKLEAQKDAVEVHLPQVSQYVALQLEA